MNAKKVIGCVIVAGFLPLYVLINGLFGDDLMDDLLRKVEAKRAILVSDTLDGLLE